MDDAHRSAFGAREIVSSPNLNTQALTVGLTGRRTVGSDRCMDP